MLLWLYSALFLVGVAKGVPPRPWSKVTDPTGCCIPSSHGNVSMLYGTMVGGSPSAFSSMAAVAFDQENFKAAAHQINPNPDDLSTTVSIIVDYTESLMYIAQPKTQQCSTEQLPVGMMGTCIPEEDNIYLGRGNLGFGSLSLPVDMWSIDGNQAGLDVQFQAWTTPGQCGFVQLNMWGDTGDAQIISSLAFYNMTAGAGDSSVFNVPTYCNGRSRAEAQDTVKLSPLMHTLKYKFMLMRRGKGNKL